MVSQDHRWTLYPQAQFVALAQRWGTLNRQTADIPFLASEFIQPLLSEFGSGEVRIAICTSGDQDIAMTILVPGGVGIWSTFQPSQLPLGPWLMRADVDVETLAPSLIRSLPGWPLNLSLTQLDPQFCARPTTGSCTSTLDYIETPWLEMTGSFDDYWQARGKNLRQNMAKQRRKLEADGIALRLEEVTNANQMLDVLADYGRLESAGWKSDGGTAIHPDNAQGRFYIAMLRGFAARGAARVYRYWFGEKVVAVDLCIEQGDTQVILKTTYDESYKAVSPAFLMRQDSFKQLWDGGKIRRIEFYGKRMEWHTRWTDSARVLYHVNHYRWPIAASLHAWRSRRNSPVQPAQPAVAPEA